MLINLINVSKSYGANIIFENLNLTIEKGDRIALIGTNGAGKSTLLNMLSGELDLDNGQINRSTFLKIGYFKQNSGLDMSATIGQEMRNALKRIYDLEKLLLLCSEKLSVNHSIQTQEEYDSLQREYEALDGYHADVRINTVLTGMGFANFERSTIISTLSGGERTRLALAKLLLESPDILILDEATNHLDFRMLMWLENYLSSYKGAIIIVSHDRYFLDRVTTQTWEVEERNIIVYLAAYSKYIVLKEERIARLQKEYDFRVSEIARFQDYHDRNIVRATTSSSAKSRLRMIEHLEEAPPPALPPKPPFFKFNSTIRPVKDVLSVKNLSITLGSKTLFDSLDLDVTRGERIAIIGENGVGKSSLLKALVGKLKYQKGEVTWGRNVKVAYFDQEDGDLNNENTALDELWHRYPTRFQHDMRTLLGNMRLVGENVYKKIGVLSGGEKAKVKLGVLILQQSNLMIMDEPTNHLDILAKEALDKGLLEYDGTLIVVSHDRYLLNRLPTRIVEIFSDRVVSFNGTFDEYISSGLGQKTEVVKEKQISSTNQYRGKKQRSEEAANKKRIANLEKDISDKEIQIKELEDNLSDTKYSSDYIELNRIAGELEICKSELDELYSQWEESNDV